MKPRKLNIFSIGLLALSITMLSCDKDESELEPEQETATRYIKRVTEPDGYADFVYDTKNRLTKISDNPNPKQMIMDFSYTTAGKLKTMKVTDMHGTNTATYVYNKQGVLTNANSNSGFSNLSYEHKDGKIIRVKAYGNIPGIGTKLMQKMEFDYKGDNVSEYREYIIDLMGSGNLKLSRKIIFEYDNKKNPFYECNIAQALVNHGYAQFASKNNRIKQTVVLPTNGEDPAGYYSPEFEYNADNYPVNDGNGTSFTYYKK